MFAESHWLQITTQPVGLGGVMTSVQPAMAMPFGRPLDSKKMSHISRSAQTARDFEEQAMPLMPLVLAMARRATRNEEDAQDLVQETYIKAYRSWHQFEQGTNLRAWLLRIMHNTHLNNVDKQNRDKAKSSIDDLEEWQVGTAESLTARSQRSAEAEAISNMTSDVVRRAIDELPENQRNVLLQVVIGGLQYKEAAEALGIPQGTVMSSFSRAKTKLREKLEEYAKQEGYNLTMPDQNNAGEVVE
jgi:RNA polymerase sigma-70 factor (ECF subfamily)